MKGETGNVVHSGSVAFSFLLELLFVCLFVSVSSRLQVPSFVSFL